MGNIQSFKAEGSIMKYKDLLDDFIKYLNESKYSLTVIRRKSALLRNKLSFALSLFYPSIYRLISSLNKYIIYYHKAIKPIQNRKQLEYIKHFIDIYKEEMKTSHYINLYVFLLEYKKRYINPDEHSSGKLYAITDFCKALGHEIDMFMITQKMYSDCLAYLKNSNIHRIVNLTKDLFIFSFEKKVVTFNPYENQPKSPYARALQADFWDLGNGRWFSYLQKYINHLQIERNLSDGGIDYQVRKLKIVLKWFYSHNIEKPNQENIKDFLKARKKKGVKDNTLSKYLYTMKYFFDFCIKKRFLKENPVSQIKIKYQEPKKGDVLTELEVNTVLEYFEDIIYQTKEAKQKGKLIKYFRAIRDLCLFQFFIFTGVRLSEISGMRLSNINFVKREIEIICKGNRLYKKKKRYLLINNYLWKTLQRYLKVRNFPGQECLWISFKGTPLANGGINRLVVSCVKKAGIDKQISPHRLRSTCSSLYVKKGMDPFSLKSLLGHESIATTMDEYTKLSDEELREIWKKTNPLRGIDDE